MKNSKMNRKKIIVVGILTLLIGVAVGLFIYKANQETSPYELYDVVSVGQGDVSITVTGEASMSTTVSNSIFIKTPQTVSNIHVSVGDRVNIGDILIEYDVSEETSNFERQLSEANLYLNNAYLSKEGIALPPTENDIIQYEAAIITAEQTLTQIEYDIESLESQMHAQRIRTSNLRGISGIYYDDYEDDVIEKEEYDTAYANYRVANAELDNLATQLEAKIVSKEAYGQLLEKSELRLENALSPLKDQGTDLRYKIQANLVSIQALNVQEINAELSKLQTETVSPINGSVVSINAVEGGTASSANAVIVLSDKGKSIVRFEASEYEAPQIKLGQKVNVTSEGIPDKIYIGNVTKIYEDALIKENSDDNEVIVPIEISLDNMDAHLKTGYTVNVELFIEQKKDVLCIPVQSIFMEEGITYVFTIQNEDVVKSALTTGLFGDKYVEVLSGVESGATIVASPSEVTEYVSDTFDSEIEEKTA